MTPGAACVTARPRVGILTSLLVALACWLWVFPAAAEVDVQLELSASVIEVGQTVQVQAKAMSSEDSPSEPRLQVSKDFVQHGPSIGTNHQISFVNGRVQRQTGITATWELTARRTGQFSIGPASVTGPDGQVTSNVVTLKVVPAGTLPTQRQRQRPTRRSPFDDDPFDLGGRSLFDDLFGRTGPSVPDAPPEYQIDHAPDDVAFLRAVVSPKEVVLGQQVTLSVYAYGARGRFREGAPREPRRTDFYSYPLVENSGRQRLYSAEIDGRRYQAVLIRRFALFPLKTGALEIGPTEITFVGTGYRSHSSTDGLVRKSNTLTVNVVEPPIEGRPADYQPGDVGNYRLEVEVSPRKIKRGDSLSVVATLQGTGNLPSRLVTPEQKGVEWLEPTLQEQVDTDRRDNVRGLRTFSYVVNVDTSGTVDLGELRLPFYNPDQKRYQVARAALGRVVVEERPATGAPNAADTASPRVRLSERMSVREQLDAAATVRGPLTDQTWFWWTVFGAPVGLVLTRGTASLLSNVSRRRREAKNSKARVVSDALAEARSKSKTGDLKGASSAIERALFGGIEDKTGIKGRALLRVELTKKLVDLGTSEALASEVESIFVALDELRFGQEEGQTEALIRQTERVLGKLKRARRSAEAGAEA